MFRGRRNAIRATDGRRRSSLVDAVAFSNSISTASYRRRALTIPAYVLAWVIVTALVPLWIPVAAVIGVLRRRSFVVLRLLLFLWAYLAIELIGLIRSGWIYLLFPRDAQKRRELFFPLSRWWGRSLFGSFRRLLSLSVVVEGDDQVLPGPLLVFIRHASIIDTALPVTYISDAKGIQLRYVFKRELLVDPCIDVAGHAWPNYFIDRGGDSERELEGIRNLTRDLGGEAILLYPEGTRFTPLKRERALRRLEEHHPELLPLAETMDHVLPPRSGGALALLDAAPQADCLIVAHRGLEGLAEVSDLLSGAVVGKQVHIRMWRIPRSEVPRRGQRLRWLFDVWKQVNDFVGEGGPASSRRAVLES